MTEDTSSTIEPKTKPAPPRNHAIELEPWRELSGEELGNRPRLHLGATSVAADDLASAYLEEHAEAIDALGRKILDLEEKHAASSVLAHSLTCQVKRHRRDNDLWRAACYVIDATGDFTLHRRDFVVDREEGERLWPSVPSDPAMAMRAIHRRVEVLRQISQTEAQRVIEIVDAHGERWAALTANEEGN